VDIAASHNPIPIDGSDVIPVSSSSTSPHHNSSAAQAKRSSPAIVLALHRTSHGTVWRHRHRAFRPPPTYFVHRHKRSVYIFIHI
jgi:hypothetical protein